MAGTLLLASGAFAWFSIKWQIGDLFAEVASPSSPDAQDIAKAAIALAPANSRGYTLSGAILKTSFDEVSISAAIDRYETAALRAPYHYRSWTELARVNEQMGRNETAEKLFLKAIELAPEYTIPRWQLGNFYLRRGRIADAVSELTAAARHPSPYRVQVFSTAWNVLGQDPRQVEEFLNDSADSRLSLAMFYASVGRGDDSLRVWNTIDQGERSQYHGWQVNSIVRDLLTHRSYRGALEFSRQARINSDARPEAFTNGDFEQPMTASDRDMRFDWTISRIDGKVEASSDTSVQHGGKRSLKLTLRGYLKPAFHVLRQAIAVEPGQRYSIGFWFRTEDLRSGSLPFVEVRNARNDQVLASSPPFPSGTNGWQSIDLDVAVPDDSDGLYVISGREPCVGECPMTGVFWLDDFSISRLD